MKREVFIHLTFLAALFLGVSLFRGWLPFDNTFVNYLPFWIGGILGTFLPDLDHFIYIYFLRPHELTSQRVNSLTSQNNWFGAVSLLYATRTERNGLVFHTVLFQMIFFLLTFLVLTSSSTFFGRGLVLGFSLHLVIDQAVDFFTMKTLQNWFKNIPFSLVGYSEQRIYLLVVTVALLIFAFLF